MAFGTHFLCQQVFRKQSANTIPHRPNSPKAYVPADTALGYVGGILCGADKLSRVAWLRSDPAIAEALGIEAVPSESSLSRFFAVSTQRTSDRLAGLIRPRCRPWRRFRSSSVTDCAQAT